MSALQTSLFAKRAAQSRVGATAVHRGQLPLFVRPNDELRDPSSLSMLLARPLGVGSPQKKVQVVAVVARWCAHLPLSDSSAWI